MVWDVHVQSLFVFTVANWVITENQIIFQIKLRRKEDINTSKWPLFMSRLSVNMHFVWNIGNAWAICYMRVCKAWLSCSEKSNKSRLCAPVFTLHCNLPSLSVDYMRSFSTITTLQVNIGWWAGRKTNPAWSMSMGKVKKGGARGMDWGTYGREREQSKHSWLGVSAI